MQLTTGYSLKTARSPAFAILTWDALWGILESTVGYVLHLLPFSAGWLVWYPVACFFMACTYLRTRKASSILCVAVLAAGIKMLDLLLPGRIDRVINPAFSILFEAAALCLAAVILQRLPERTKSSPAAKALVSIGMNTGWRLLYILYLLFLVPQWIRDVSVISSQQALIRFLVMDNLASSAIVFAGFWAAKPVLERFQRFSRMQGGAGILRLGTSAAAKAVALTLLLGADVLLQMLL